ncbi:S8 family peptidase [Congregibacter litoralis]|uniref:Subtilisin-like serine protease n=1 Tax=Congregibacter litoralis KT71 TaxID=314285 RepID=A4A5P5_9GAMM|nr:S8 family peptidase [Congregibacter litoralis]EAQ98342.1 Subtilisin-like serine protease [Congregibacter litoralis KT71]
MCQRFYQSTALLFCTALMALLFLSLLVSPGATGMEAPDERSEDLLVMIQGTDLDAIVQSAERHGATVTHHLPIINAVGARMDAGQLSTILEETPGITRSIDDLAWEPAPEAPDLGQCPLRAAIELRWQDRSASWRLFNKSDRLLTVGQGSLSWPAELGSLQSAYWDSSKLSIRKSPDNARDVVWQGVHELTLTAGEIVELRFEFENPPAASDALQNQLTLQARVDDDCIAELVPSYSQPLQDSYYPTVSGAALLHSHGITGRDITVAVLDSGLWEANAELTLDTQGKERVLARYDAIAGVEMDEAFDASGHGTHMTSVLARSGEVTRDGTARPSYRGIAPDAKLVVVKAFDESGKAGFLDIVRGVQWVVDNRERLNIRVLNLSFAARPRWPYWEDPVNQALMQAWKAGIFIAAAAGNEGPEPMTVGSPGNLPYLLTVGAVTDSWTEDIRDDDYIPDFSSRGPTPMGHIKPDLVAMGGHISGIIRPGSTLSQQLPEYLLQSGEFVMTGTSQATALVSGLVTLMLQISPELNNDELKCMLLTSAEPAIEVDGRYAYSPFAQGKGMINIQRALTVGAAQCQQASLDLDADIDGRQHFQGPAVFSDGAPPSLPGQSDVISERASEKGLSESRRWGVGAHLERLKEKPRSGPIDWLEIYRTEQQRIEELATDEQKN